MCPKVDTPDGTFRFISLYAKNREEWIETDLGCALTSITVVTLYDTLGKDSIEYILDQAFVKTLVLSADKIKTINELKKAGKMPLLTHLIYFDEAKPEDLENAKNAGLTTIDYESVIKEGLNLVADLEPPTADSVYTLCYTSGTTGMPKGVMLTHRNIVSNTSAIQRFDGIFHFKEDDVYISYLPLAHVLERMCMISCMVY